VKGKVALVTGGGADWSPHVALALAQAGADVALNYRKDVEQATRPRKRFARSVATALPVLAMFPMRSRSRA